MDTRDIPLVQTQGLVKEYRRRRVVDGVDIRVRAGEIVGLLGPNGAGKTTSFYMIIGLVAPTAGRVYFEGQDVTRMPMSRRARMGMGYWAQEPSVFRQLTVAENVMAILETLPIPARERLAAAAPARRAQDRAPGEPEGVHAQRWRAPAARDHAGPGDEPVADHARRTVQRGRPSGGVRRAADRHRSEGAGSRNPDHGPQCPRDPRGGRSRHLICEGRCSAKGPATSSSTTWSAGSCTSGRDSACRTRTNQETPP